MAKVLVEFVLTAPNTLRYAVDVDGTGVTLVDNKGSLRLNSGEEAVMRWWMVGNPGDTLAAIASVGAREVLKIKGSKVPTGSTKGSGYRRFTP